MKLKKGISGGKPVAAATAQSKSIPFTGLSGKEKGTEATCCNCGVTWHI